MDRPLIRIIGKIVINQRQMDLISRMNVDYVADENPSPNDQNEILSRIGNAQIIINNISTPISADIMRQCPDLKFIQTWSTGVDNIDLEEAKKLGIRVSNVPDFSTEAVAEKTIGLMLLAANQFHNANAHANSGQWNYQKFQGLELKGKTLCIVGYGTIGKRVAELASAFGMTILSIHRTTTEEEFNEALNVSHIVTVHCPLNSSTKHLISTKQFNQMKNVILINNSRGGIVDEVALIKALDSGQVRFATMDVTEQEPPSLDNPILNHDLIFVTPHIAWNTQESVEKLTDSVLSNIDFYLRNEFYNFIV